MACCRASGAPARPSSCSIWRRRSGTGQPFLGHPVKRQCGVLLIAAEGASEVRLRLDAVVRHKCGNMERAPFRWYETTPLLLQKGAVETLIAMARQADDSLQQEFGLPLGLIVIDTIAACAGYTRAGDENDLGSRPGRDECAEGVGTDARLLRAGRRSLRQERGGRHPWRLQPRRAPAIWCWPASATSSSAAASPTQGWPCGRTGAASRARNTRSPCASWRRRSRTKTGSRSPPWWWIGSRRHAGRSIRAGAGSVGAKPAARSAHRRAAAEAGADGRHG